MIVLAWVLGSLLLGALVAMFALYGRLGNVEKKLDASDNRVTYLRNEVEYWLGLYDTAFKRNLAYREALLDIKAMATPNMANIGHRMAKRAKLGLTEAFRAKHERS